MDEKNFEFQLDLAKAEEREGRMFLSGVASTTGVDLQNDAFSERALTAMATSAIGQPLTKDHSGEMDSEIGSIVKAEVRDNQLWIEGELDNDEIAKRLFTKIQKSKKAGFSVGAAMLSKPTLNKSHRVINDVKLLHVMVTSKPVNTQTFCIAVNKALLSPEDSHTMNTDNEKDEVTLEKAGAKFSADSKAKLKAIHDAGSNDVKSKVVGMLGDEADDGFWNPGQSESFNDGVDAAGDDSDSDAGVSEFKAPQVPVASAPVGSDTSDGSGKFMGIIGKSEFDALKAEMDAMKADFLAKSESIDAKELELAAKQSDLDSKIEELNKAIAVFTNETANIVKSKAVDSNPIIPKPSNDEIFKSSRNMSDLIKSQLAMRAISG